MECGRQRSKVKTLLLQCFALRKVHVIDGQNTRDQITSDQGPNANDQIAFFAFHSFLVEVQMKAGYIHNADKVGHI